MTYSNMYSIQPDVDKINHCISQIQTHTRYMQERFNLLHRVLCIVLENSAHVYIEITDEFLRTYSDKNLNFNADPLSNKLTIKVVK